MQKVEAVVNKPVKSNFLRASLNRLIGFLRRQFIQIRNGGLPVLIQKLYTLILVLPALMTVLVMRTLRPLILIRLGPHIIDRIGHLAGEKEIYLCERDAGMHPQKSFDVFYHWNVGVCNQQLLKMWYRTLRNYPRVKFIASYFIGQVDRFNRMLPGGKVHALPKPNGFDTYHLFRRMPAHLSFTYEEEQLGKEFLRNLGIPENKEFICFHNRDSLYLVVLYNFEDRGFKRHDYRDSSIRNYVAAMEELARRGYFIFRMGAVVKEPLSTTDNSMIIDYATKYRSDFLDMYLGAKCKFFVGTASGLYSIPFIFRRPIAHANFSPIVPKFVGGSKDIFIPKKFWLRKEKRFLTFKELFNTGIGTIMDARQYQSLGVGVVENTSDEIIAFVLEMDERLKGTWQMTREAQDLLKRYRRLLKPEARGGLMENIGTEFLRQNQELLDN